MAKFVSSAFLTSAADERAEKPSRKIPIGWTILGAAVFSFAIWYEIIVFAIRVIRHMVGAA